MKDTCLESLMKKSERKKYLSRKKKQEFHRSVLQFHSVPET